MKKLFATFNWQRLAFVHILKRTNLRVFLAAILFSTGLILAAFGFASQEPSPRPLVLRAEEHDLGSLAALAKWKQTSASKHLRSIFRVAPSVPAPNTPSFGHPIIAGIGGTGFEESIRVDPTLNANGEH